MIKFNICEDDISFGTHEWNVIADHFSKWSELFMRYSQFILQSSEPLITFRVWFDENPDYGIRVSAELTSTDEHQLDFEYTLIITWDELSPYKH